MDTRTKIIPAEEALRLAAQGATVVSGYFDPLIADHAVRLHELRQVDSSLLVAIAPPPDEILPSRARMELVAALACVDYVTELSAALPVQIHLEEEHAAGRRKLVQHVHQRQQAVR